VLPRSPKFGIDVCQKIGSLLLQFPLALLYLCMFSLFLIDVGGTLYSPYRRGVIEHLWVSFFFCCENGWSGTHTSKRRMEISSYFILHLSCNWDYYGAGVYIKLATIIVPLLACILPLWLGCTDRTTDFLQILLWKCCGKFWNAKKSVWRHVGKTTSFWVVFQVQKLRDLIEDADYARVSC